MIRLSMTRKQFVYSLGTLTTVPVLLFAMGGLFVATIYSRVPQSDATIASDVVPISASTELAMIEFNAIEAQDSTNTDMYAVQIGSFSEEKNAQEIAQALEINGYSVATLVVRDSETWENQYKVRVGNYLSRAEADAAAKRYREEARSPAFVISPSPAQGTSTQNVEPLSG